MSSPEPYGQQNSGGGSFFTIVLVILGIILLMCAGVCGGCVFLGYRAQQGAQQMLQTLSLAIRVGAPFMAVSNSPEVIAKIGEPIEHNGENAMREISPNEIAVDIKGPSGTAVMTVLYRGTAPNQELSGVKVTFEDGSTIDIPLEAVKAAELREMSGEEMDSEAMPLDPSGDSEETTTPEKLESLEKALEEDPNLNIPLETK